MSGYVSAIVTAGSAIGPIIEWFSGSSEKTLDIKQIAISPMIAMMQLALLHHHSEGTKFDFANHQIVFYEPVVGQGAQRKKNGSSRDVVLKLEPLIETALKWYQPHEDVKVQKIFLRTIRGLKVLKKTYKDSDMVKQCIDRYIQKIAEACLKGFPKADPVNPYQQRVYQLGLREIDRLTDILSEFPGDSAPFEFDQKLEKELLELQSPDSDNLLNTHRKSVGGQNGSIGDGQDVESNQADLSVVANEPESKVQQDSISPRVENHAEKNDTKSKKGKKEQANVQHKEKEKVSSSGDHRQSSSQNAEASPAIIHGHSQTSHQNPEKKPAVPVMSAAEKTARIGEILLQQKRFRDESLKKLIDEDVVSHIPSAEKMSKITDYLNGEVTDLSKIADAEVVNLLQFK